MKPSLLIAATLVATIRASQFKTPLTASIIADIARRTELMLPEIHMAPEAGYMGMSFEEVIANVVIHCSAVYYRSVELRGMNIAEKLDNLFPGQGYNLKTDDEAAEDAKESGTMTDGEVREELKKRQNLGDEGADEIPIAESEVVVRPQACIELQEAVQNFNKHFRALLSVALLLSPIRPPRVKTPKTGVSLTPAENRYLTAKKCSVRCSTNGSVVKAVTQLESRYKASEFEARVRSAEREAGCQNSAVEVGANLVALREVSQALRDHEMSY